jgi:hypothetical protein
MIAVVGGIADVGRDLIRARTAEGRCRAKARGQHNPRRDQDIANRFTLNARSSLKQNTDGAPRPYLQYENPGKGQGIQLAAGMGGQVNSDAPKTATRLRHGWTATPTATRPEKFMTVLPSFALAKAGYRRPS